MKEGVFPYDLKQAIVRPRWKKPTFYLAQLSSYHPISNLSFISKTIERFSEHIDAEHLRPSRQSAYRAHHSTETAVTAVHDELVRDIDSGRVLALISLDLSSLST